MKNSQQLVDEYGVKGAISSLRSQLPSGYIPKILRDKREYVEIRSLIDEVKSLCSHRSTRSECIDYHRRDFGTICNDCGEILNTNA